MTLVDTRSRTRTPSGWNLMPGLQDVMAEFEPLFSEFGSPVSGRRDAGAWASGYPVDLYETADTVILEMAVPGIAVDDIHITVEGRQLTLQGRLPELEGEQQRRYWLRTIPRGEFRRTITLPGQVDLDAVQARVDQGLLTLTMPKAADARARKIDVQAG